MSYTSESGRLQILEDAAAAAGELSAALAAFGEAYEHLDEQAAQRAEDRLFRPLQAAYGQLGRTLTEFAQRYDLPEQRPAEAPIPAPGDPRVLLERVAEAAATADETLAELQDSMLPVEVGDQPLRAGLSSVRTLVAPLPAVCESLVRSFGR
jgi:hypothetical protein